MASAPAPRVWRTSPTQKSKIFFLRRVHSSATDVRKTFARVRLEQQTQILVKEQAEIPQNQQAGPGSSGGHFRG